MKKYLFKWQILWTVICFIVIGQSVLYAFDVDAGEDKVICLGSSTEIGGNPTAENSTLDTYTYLWDNAETLSCLDCPNPTATPTKMTIYTVTVMDGGGFVCTDEVRIDVASIDLVDEDGNILNHIDIGHWGKDQPVSISFGKIMGTQGFDKINSTTYQVKNGIDENDNFIDLDDDKFFVRVRLIEAITPPSIFNANISLATLENFNIISETNNIQDAYTPIPMYLEPLSPSNPEIVYLSKSQLLTAPDMFVNPDDQFAVHDGVNGPVNDEAIGDRTHKTNIHGGVKVKYTLNGELCDNTVPVCDRFPEERRILYIRAHIFKSPDPNKVTFFGTGTEQEAKDFIHAQIKRANISWQQACIEVKLDGPILLEDAPVGVYSLQDTWLESVLSTDPNTSSDYTPIISAYSNILTKDILHVFFVGEILTSKGSALGTTLAPVNNSATLPLGENTIMFISSNANMNDSTLAHEIGHALDNIKEDSNRDRPVFYPSTDKSNTVSINNLTEHRRITKKSEMICRTERPIGLTSSIGNQLLQLP